MPLPFRLLVAPGGFGRTGDGTTWNGRILSDGAINSLSEDRTLDFSFGQVLSNDAGTLYTFKAPAGDEARPIRGSPPTEVPRGSRRCRSASWPALSGSPRGGTPRTSRGGSSSWTGSPAIRHLVGFDAVRSLLTGKPLELRLDVAGEAEATGPGWAEFSVRATSAGPTPTDLSRYNNWVQVRVEGGVFSALRLGDFDRFELLSSQAEGYRPVTFGRAVVARLFENLFAPGETKQAGPIRVSGRAAEGLPELAPDRPGREDRGRPRDRGAARGAEARAEGEARAADLRRR